MTTSLPQPNGVGRASLDVGVSLMAALQGPQQAEKEQVILVSADEWCKEERARLVNLSDGSVGDSELKQCIDNIHREVQSLCIAVLQHDLHELWSYFVKVLKLMEPIKLYLQDLPECEHYLERIVERFNNQNSPLDDLNVVAALSQVFPQQIQSVRERNARPKHTYCTPIPPVVSVTAEPRRSVRYKTRAPHRSILLPDGTNPFLLDRPGEEDKFNAVNESLTFADLRKSIAAVGREAAQRESVWNSSAGFLLNAFEADLPEDPRLVPRSHQTPLSAIDEQGKAKAIMDEAMRASSQAAGTVLPEGPMTAREAVAHFAQLYHLGKIRHMYFNIVDQTRWSPYDLIAVPRQKINAEHYVFSTFGVLSVSKHQPCEVLSLGEWFRQAVIHKAISNIPFFKNYLIRRYFHGWVAVRRRAEYEKRQKEIGLSILRAVSNYNNACLSVCKLLYELATVSFLPLDTTVCYTIGAWRNMVNYRNIQSEKLLERFYMHCRNLIEHARKEQFEKLSFWEKQVSNKAIFTKESLHISNKKQRLREDNLKQCKAETNRLGNFVKLVDQLILAQLLDIIKNSVGSFVSSVLQNVPEQSRESLFKCSLQFNPQGELCTCPSREEFTEAILGSIYDLPQLLCDVSYGIDADYLVTDRVDSMRPETRYTALGATSKGKASLPSGATGSAVKPVGVQKHVRLTVAELKSHTARSEGVEETSLNTPQKHQTKYPSKADNDLLILTPDLALPMDNELELVGRGYAGRYAPLASGNVSQLLELDPNYEKVFTEGSSILQEAFDEIQVFVQESSWFNEIEQFCQTWNVAAKLSWKGAQAFHIEDYNPREQASIVEQQLSTIRTWTERIKNFEKSFLSTNQVVLIDCSHMHTTLVPKLNDIYRDIIEFVAEESFKLAADFIANMKRIVQNMKNKESEISAFALYAKQVHGYKRNTAAYQQEVEYIKSLFEVVRMSYRQLSADEERLEGQVIQQWETFLTQIQDASEFINTQTPITMKSLEEDHETLMAEAERLGEAATTGKFLNPDENPTDMLIDMRHLRDRFYTVRKKLEQASKWREAIAGKGYELDLLQEIADAMRVRQELWKYVQVSTHSIKDWKSQLFKKMSTQKALDKITEWLAIATQMQSFLPAGDNVLAYWFSTLEHFKKDLPLLHKMASDALKPAHWHAIFVGMGEAYEQDWEFTVEELLAYNLASHQGLIDAIFSRARAEYRLEQKLNKIEKLWTSNDVYFKLAKHIPDSVYIADKSRTEQRRLGVGEKRSSSRQTPVAPVPKGLDTTSEDLYILIETEELQYLLEDSQVSLQQMLSSPYIAGFRSTTETLHYKLREIEELLQLWLNCQAKWLYLMKLFEDPKLYSGMSSQAFAFEGVHSEMKDIQKSVLADPGVMSVTSHVRGEKGYKAIQGENLRRMFTHMISIEEAILKDFGSQIESLRQSFPRLYFVTDDDLIHMMSIVRSPQHFIPIASKCFPALNTVRFKLPTHFQNSANIALDYQLNGDKLEAVHVFGEHDECVTLIERVGPLHHGPSWLSQMDKQLRLTLVSQLQNCLLDHLYSDNPDMMSVLEEVANVEEERRNRQVTDSTKQSVSLPMHLTKEVNIWNHRLLKYPMQCLIATQQILWSHKMTQLFKSSKSVKEDMTAIRDNLQQKMERLVLVIKHNSSLLYSRVEHSRMRLSLVLRGLVHCYMQLIGATDRLLAAHVSCANCYDWSSTFRYCMEITPLLRAKTFVQVTEEKLEHNYHRERSLGVSSGNTGPRSPRAPLTPVGRRQANYLSGGSKCQVILNAVGDELLEKQKTSVEMVSTYAFGALHVQQLDSTVQYSHEYQGPSCSFINTALGERVNYSLMIAMKDYRLGTVMGPSCSGKTETILSLARLLGACVFPITCSSQMELSNLQRMLSGVVQSGCWALFDSSDRLTVELMSVAAQQLQTILSALRTLRYSSAYEYTSRGVAVAEQQTKQVRRNSLTTLHTLQRDEDAVKQSKTPHLLSRVNTFIPERERTTTSIADSEKQRRHSIDRGSFVRESEVYTETPPPSLFYDNIPSQKVPFEEQKEKDLRHLVSEPVAYEPRYLGDIMYGGHLIPARDNSAFFMVFNSNSSRYEQVPQSLRLLMRPCAMIEPDRQTIVQTFLYSWGYDNHPSITKKLMLFIKFCQTELHSFSLTLKTLLQVLQIAVERFYNPALSPEFKEPKEPTDGGFALPEPDRYEESIVFGLSALLLPRLDSESESARFRDIVRDVFPLCADIYPSHHHSELVQAIKDQLRTDGMHQSKDLLEKVLQLYSALQQNSNVIICGASGSGKTVLYKTLSLALNRIHSKKNESNVAQLSDDIQPSQPMASFRQNMPKPEDQLYSVEFLKSLEARDKSQLIKKWGNVSRSFVRLRSLHKLVTDAAPEVVYPKVHLTSLCPSAMTPDELFGHCEDGKWRDGTLTHLLQSANRHVNSAETFTQLYSEKKAKNGVEEPTIIDNWIVLDGDVSPHWVDGLSSMMDSNKKLTLANGESMDSTSFTSLLFETGTLKDASPSSVARCSVVHCSQSINHWKSLISSWMLQARHKWVFNTSSLKVLNSMITDMFEPSLTFLENELETALDTHLTSRHGSYRNSVRGIHEVQTFLRIITALLNKYMLRDATSTADASLTAGMSFGESGLSESQASASGGLRSQSTSTSKSVQDEDYVTHEKLVKCIFVYSYIWGFGGHLSDSSRIKFDQYVKEALYRCSSSVTLPRTGSVYDLFVDVKECTLTKWQDKPAERLRSVPANYATTSDIERIFHIADLLVSAHNHVLITGAPGVGKTALVTNMLMTRQHYTKIAMCPGLSSAQFQHVVIARLQDLRQKTVFSLGPQGGGVKPPQRHMFFIDDLSTAAPLSARDSTQPCLEALREMISHRITYDRKRHVFEDAKPATFVMACSTPGYAGSGFGVNAQSPSDRLIRQMTVLNFFSLTDDAMHSLYGKTLQTWLEEFPSYAVEHHYELAKAMMQGMLDLYELMRSKFKATPTHSHYVFTLHDIGHIVEGMLLLSPRKTKSKPRRARAKKENAATASNVQSLFGGMLPGGKVSKEKFRSLSVKDSKDTKNQSADAALPMMPVLVRLWCHEVSRTFADRLLEDEDDIWFKRTLRDLVEKHFCTASPDWIDSHAASRHMRAVMEDKQLYEKSNKEAMKGTPLPFGHALGGDAESDDSDLSDGTMTEVTTDVVTPFSERDMDPDSFMHNHGVDKKTVVVEDNNSEEEAYQGAITPFTETTINLADGPMSPEAEDEKPTFDDYQDGNQYNQMYERQMAERAANSSSDESDNSEDGTVAIGGVSEAVTAPPALQAAEEASVIGVSISETMSAPDLRKPMRAQMLTAALHTHKVQQPAAVGGVIKKRKSLQRRADSKRGVTFKMGLIADKEVQEEYKGALMTFDEIRNVASDDLSEIVFSKHYISAYADFVGMNSERGYAQYTETQIAEALQACLHIYNQNTHSKLKLVFFREAVRHATRISRILSFAGAHALLLGLPHSAGRATLVRLATHISHCKLFEVKPLETEEKTMADFKRKVTQCSHMAGVNGRTSILYVHSGVPEKVLGDVCSLMTDGRYPGLYSDVDIQNMATAMTPGQVQTKKLDKIELSFERYLKKVRQNVHIITSLDISASTGMDTYTLLQKYPQLVTKSMHVDSYKPWSFETYQYVAKRWLSSPHGPEKVKWDRQLYMEQLTCVSKAMAYVHKTSEQAIVQLHCHSKHLSAHKIYSPLTFLEFYHLFNHTASMIHKRAEARIKVLKQVHGKVNEAFSSIRSRETEADNVAPKLDEASVLVGELRSKVEQWRQKYIDALQISKECEERLEELKKPLLHLRGEAEAEFDKVNVTYYAAMAAINSLTQHDLEELKSYRKPPAMIHIVGEALCIMFDQPTTDWETAQQLMFSKNFFQDMEFYDKSHLSSKIYKALNKLCNSPDFQPELIAKGSTAASAICGWIHSVYKYAEIYKRIAPKLAKLMEAEAEVTKTQAELGQKRLHATKTKKELEDLISEHKEASQSAKAIERQYQAMRRHITEAKEVMNNMDLQIKIWRSELVEAEIQMDCAPGDAMLVAAICCYQGPLDAHTRETLTNDWRERCHLNQFNTNVYIEPELAKISTTGRVVDLPSANDRMRMGLRSPEDIKEPIRPQKEPKQPIVISENFSLESVLSDFTEMSGWVREGLGHDVHNLHSALILVTCANNHNNYWPLLIDPDDRAESIIRITNRLKNASASAGCSEPTKENTELSLPANVVLPPVSARSEGADAADTTYTSETDSQSIVSHSVLSHTTRNQSLSVRRSSGSNELAPVQLVKEFEDRSEIDSQLRADREIHRPSDNLWVVSSTDALLVKHIINALVHGIVILVTHTDRKSLPDDLFNIIYKNFHKDEGNNSRLLVNVKDFTYEVHDCFRLYMSASAAPGVKGDDSRPMPYGHCNLIDLAHSQQARVDVILDDIMRVEKAEHEAQTRALEGGILHHKQELNAEQDLIQNMILSGTQAILDDESMLSTLKQSNQSIVRNGQILEETLYLSNQLQQKRESYTPVALYAAMMYEVIGYMTLLSPYYCLPFDRYQTLCRSTVQSRHRGKGVAGDPKARCQELINAITEQVFQLMKCILFEDDWLLFALLVAIQRMSSNHQFTSEELHVFVNDVKHIKLRSAVNSKEKPHWIEYESWLSCYKLEESLSCFAGLIDSLVERSDEWNEYFTRTMSVVNHLPGASLSLSLLQKSILWRIVLPHRFSEVCSNLLLTELGPSVLSSQSFTAEQSLANELQSRPALLLEPALLEPAVGEEDTEYTDISCDPCELIKSLLPKDLSHRFTVLSFGVGVTMADVESSLHYCMKNGIWLILKNCHLAPRWSDKVLQLLEKILAIQQVVYQKSENRHKKVPVVPYETLNPGVNPNFTLWFTTQPKADGRLLPLSVVWNSTKYVLEQRRSYQHLLSSIYQHCLANISLPRDTCPTVKVLASELLLPLSILHSQLLQRRRYSLAAFKSAPRWNITDLNLVMSLMRTELSRCNGSSKFTDLVLSIYKPYCTTEEDAEAVEAVIRNVLRTRAELEDHEVEVNSRGSQALLATLVDGSHTTSHDILQRIDSLVGNDSSVLSLSESADSYLKLIRSSKMIRLLSKVSGHPGVLDDSTQHQDVFERVDVLLSGWESVLHALPQLSYSPDDQLNMLQQFLYKQVEAYKHIIQVLLKDSELLHGITRTEFSCCTESLHTIYQLYMGKVPDKWKQLLSSNADTLMQWKADAELGCNLLMKYIDKESSPLSYNLSAFTQPSLFLQSLFIQHARSQYLDVNDLQLHTEFLPMGFKPTKPPAAGCYISGLRVHNALWDTSTSTVQPFTVNDVSPTNQMPLLHLLPKVRESDMPGTCIQYQCALVCSEVATADNAANVVMYLDLPVKSESQSRLLRERNVFLSTSLKPGAI